jgi:hypothetical protein
MGGGGTEELGEKPAPVPFFHQGSHFLSLGTGPGVSGEKTASRRLNYGMLYLSVGLYLSTVISPITRLVYNRKLFP